MISARLAWWAACRNAASWAKSAAGAAWAGPVVASIPATTPMRTAVLRTTSPVEVVTDDMFPPGTPGRANHAGYCRGPDDGDEAANQRRAARPPQRAGGGERARRHPRRAGAGRVRRAHHRP